MTSPWQPLTLAGVASFARGTLGRLLAVQGIVASVVAAVVVWVAGVAWIPALNQAVLHLPATGAIRRGQLDWPDTRGVTLVDGTFLAVEVDPTGTAEPGHNADLMIELRAREWRVHSLLGYVSLPYPRGWTISLNRPALEPAWGAWKPALLAALGISVVAALLASWLALATAYFPAARFIAWFTDRAVTAGGCWRLAGAALMPGALLMSGAIFFYSLQRLNLIELLAAQLAHLAVGWGFVLLAPFRLPRSEADAPKNPFATLGASGRPPNPFAEGPPGSGTGDPKSREPQA